MPLHFANNTRDATAQNLQGYGLRNVSENSDLDAEFARYERDMNDDKRKGTKLAHLNFYDLRSPALAALFAGKSNVVFELGKIKQVSEKSYHHHLIM